MFWVQASDANCPPEPKVGRSSRPSPAKEYQGLEAHDRAFSFCRKYHSPHYSPHSPKNKGNSGGCCLIVEAQSWRGSRGRSHPLVSAFSQKHRVRLRFYPCWGWAGVTIFRSPHLSCGEEGGMSPFRGGGGSVWDPYGNLTQPILDFQYPSDDQTEPALGKILWWFVGQGFWED